MTPSMASTSSVSAVDKQGKGCFEDLHITLLLLSGILDFFWALFFFKVRGVAGAAKNENQK